MCWLKEDVEMNSTGTSPFQCKYACRYTIHNSAFLPEEASIVLLLECCFVFLHSLMHLLHSLMHLLLRSLMHLCDGKEHKQVQEQGGGVYRQGGGVYRCDLCCCAA